MHEWIQRSMSCNDLTCPPWATKALSTISECSIHSLKSSIILVPTVCVHTAWHDMHGPSIQLKICSYPFKSWEGLSWSWFNINTAWSPVRPCKFLLLCLCARALQVNKIWYRGSLGMRLALEESQSSDTKYCTIHNFTIAYTGKKRTCIYVETQLHNSPQAKSHKIHVTI